MFSDNTSAYENSLHSVTKSCSIVAIFDFDGTLTYQDSFLPFLKWTYGKLYWLKLLPHILFLVGYLLGFVSNHQIKEILLFDFFKEWSKTTLELTAAQYANQVIPKLLNPAAIERLQWHQAQGHQVLLVSANLEIYLEPWAKAMGIDQVLATQLDFEDDKFRGKIKGKCCIGDEKVTRLKEFLGSFNNYCLHIYGDSEGDKEMLAISDFTYYRTFTASNCSHLSLNSRSSDEG